MSWHSADHASRILIKNQTKRQSKGRNATARKVSSDLSDDASVVQSISNISMESNLVNYMASLQCSQNGYEYPKYTDEDRQMAMSSNNHWPFLDRPDELISQAPFTLNTYRNPNYFRLPRAQQSSALFTSFTGFDHPVLQILFAQHFPVANYAATCQDAYLTVNKLIDQWDLTRGNFCGCDKNPEEYAAGVSSILTVAPFRWNEIKKITFHRQLCGVQRLLKSINHYADQFQTLHLHRIPLLTTNILKLVVPYMRQLKNLGIYRCELIHLGDTEELLDIVHHKHRRTGQTQHINLDFYPRFHQGPVREPIDGAFYGGSYGVTWDNSKLDTRISIAKILIDVLPQAQRQDIDLISKDSAFRVWLEKSPLEHVQEIIDIILEVSARNGSQSALYLSEQIATIAAWERTGGELSKWKKLSDWARTEHQCGSCGYRVLGIYFDIDEFMEFNHYQPTDEHTVYVDGDNDSDDEWGQDYIQAHTYPASNYVMSCSGCRLTQYLNQEEDHNKHAKLALSNHWLRTPVIPQEFDEKTGRLRRKIETEDLAAVVSEQQMLRSLKRAKRFDKDQDRRWTIWHIDLDDFETQREIENRQQGRKMRGFGPQAPKTDEKGRHKKRNDPW